MLQSVNIKYHRENAMNILFVLTDILSEQFIYLFFKVSGCVL